jgi:hypothetical protein
MANRVRYDKALLDSVIQRDGATLIGEYEKLTLDSKINFICNCQSKDTKTFEKMVTGCGVKCKKCQRKEIQEKLKKTNLVKYGVECILKSKEIQNKIKETNIKKYGVEHAMQNKEVQEKQQLTTLNKYGVANTSQHENIKEQIKKTRNLTSRYNYDNLTINLREYKSELIGYTDTVLNKESIIKFKCKCGNIKEKSFKCILDKGGSLCEECTELNKIKRMKSTFTAKYDCHPSKLDETKEKQKDTNLKKYGVISVSQVEKFQEKIKKTNLEKYGCERPTQNPEIQENAQKNAKKFKEYKMPSGTIRKVQGYEPFALDTLVKTYTEEQIKTDRRDVPHIQYEIDGKKKVYFPDIFIPHLNMIIEVKSTWTIKLHSNLVELKGDACKEKGYTYELWCFNSKGVRVEV